MLTHAAIWSAIDALAARKGMSVSALAKIAGLDATTFNRSKRKSVDGNARWPSTESVAKILAATQTSVDEFLGMIPRAAPVAALIPFRGMKTTPNAAFDEKLNPSGEGWEAIAAPMAKPGIFAFAVEDDSSQPFYRRGDILIASAQAEARAGDRVAVIGVAGDLALAILAPSSAQTLNLTALDGRPMPALPRSDIRAVARILWASQ
jgi:phage repressor protein C with HTH and peptisase S24 domain